MRAALIAALLAGCAADAGPVRWHQDALTLCAPPDVPVDALLSAAGAWGAYGPSVGLVQQYPCDISVLWGEPDEVATAVRTVGSEGDIRFATIELHEGLPWGDAALDPGVYDFQAVLTHEIGHALGLEHVDDEDAAMHAETGRGDTGPRTLSAADVEAVRALYR